MNTLPDSATKPPLLRRASALVYDLLGVLAVCLLAGFPPVLINGGAITTDDGIAYIAYLAYNLTLAVGYFAVSWRLKHCTLGMKAWRLELVSVDGTPFTWPQLIKRALVGIVAWAPAGAGIWWQYLDAEGRTWQDRISATRMVVLKKRKKT